MKPLFGTWEEVELSDGIEYLLHHHERHQGVHFVGEDLVQGVTVVPQRHSAVRGHLDEHGEHSGHVLFTKVKSPKSASVTNSHR